MASRWDIKELNKGARFNGYKNWSDPALKANKNAVSRILKYLSNHDGIWEVPLTPAEINRLTKIKHTWASVTAEFPDFEKGMKDYLDNKTTKPDLKKINKLKISSEAKWNEMSGTQKQFILKHNKKQFQPFKNSITVPEMGELSKFKSIRDVLVPVSAKSYNYKNGVKVLDNKFYAANRAYLFQDYLKQEGMERLAVSAQGAKGEQFMGRWILTDKAIKDGKTFAGIIGAYPNLRGKPSTEYKNILDTVTKNHPVYKDTQQGLRSLFNFVKNSINSDMRALKPADLRILVANNPTLLKQVTSYVDSVSKTIIHQGVAGLENLSTEQILKRALLITEHNRPMRDYAAKYMDKDRLKVLRRNFLNIDANMTHNISLASGQYNNSLKETATNLAEANKNNPKVLEHLSNEFKKINQRFYANNRFYGAEIATSPSYRTSVFDYWRNNLKGTGLQHLWDKYAGQYSKKGVTLDDIMRQTLKNPDSLKQLAGFVGCRITTFDEGGRVRLQAGGQGVVQCVETKLKQPGAMEKIAQLPEEVGGALGKLKNVARGFLGALGKFGPAAGKYGAIAAAGALAQPLVKQFMNDDPSTYLTDPEQTEGMLLSTIEAQERKKPRSEILDWGTTAGTLGATAAAVPGTGALYKFRRGLSEAKIPKAGPITESGLTAGDYLSKHAGKGYGKLRAGAGVGMKLLSGMFTPAGLLATEPLRIAQKRREGESWGDIGTDPTMWMGPAFAPSMTRMATRGMKAGSLLPKLLRLGVSRGALAAMGPVGWAGLAASLGWEGRKQYQDYKKKRGFFARDEE